MRVEVGSVSSDTMDRQLQTDEHEREAVDEEDDDVPHARPTSRPSGLRTRAARRPAMSPATTAASTPLTPSASAGR